MTDALKLAADDGDLKEVKRLIEQQKVSISQADDWGDTALHAAVAKGRINVVIYLLDNGIDPNIQNKVGSTALHKGAVAKYDQLQIIRRLLDHKADPLLRNNSGLLPEQLATGDLAKRILAGSEFVEEFIDVPRSKHGRIIGKGGSKMRQVQSESGAHVNIPKQDKNSDTITIKGRRESVAKAKQLILDLVKGDGGDGEGAEDGKTSTKFSVPKDKHRLIIGRGGGTVNEIREECGVDIVIPPVNSNDEDLIIRGDPDNITKAIKAIQEITGNARGGGGGGYGGGYGGGRGGGNGGYGGRSTPDGNRGRSTPDGGSRGGRNSGPRN